MLQKVYLHLIGQLCLGVYLNLCWVEAVTILLDNAAKSKTNGGVKACMRPTGVNSATMAATAASSLNLSVYAVPSC